MKPRYLLHIFTACCWTRRRFPRAADGGQRLPPSWAETGHGAGGQTHPAAQQDLPSDPHRPGGHQSESRLTHPAGLLLSSELKAILRNVQQKFYLQSLSVALHYIIVR